MTSMGYQQINADHTVFSQQHGSHITMIAVYVDDMIITGDDDGEIARLKGKIGEGIRGKGSETT
jgi:hypothetical protein